MTLAGPEMRHASKLILAIVVAIAIVSSYANAQENSDTNPIPAPDTTLTGRKIVSSVFETDSTIVDASCGTSSCQALVTLLPQVNLPCPGAVGTTCTFFFLIESNIQVSPVDQGSYRIFVDGSPASPGPVDSSGLYKLVESDPNSGQPHTASAGIVSTRKNSSANQVHHATVSLGCQDETGDGCFAFATLSSLRVDIFQP